MDACIIKDCPDEGTHKITIDIGEYLDDNLYITQESRERGIIVCDRHYKMLNAEFHRGYSIGFKQGRARLN